MPGTNASSQLVVGVLGDDAGVVNVVPYVAGLKFIGSVVSITHVGIDVPTLNALYSKASEFPAIKLLIRLCIIFAGNTGVKDGNTCVRIAPDGTFLLSRIAPLPSTFVPSAAVVSIAITVLGSLDLYAATSTPEAGGGVPLAACCVAIPEIMIIAGTFEASAVFAASVLLLLEPPHAARVAKTARLSLLMPHAASDRGGPATFLSV